MGYIRHDAIVVTAFDKSHLRAALKKAETLGLPVSEPVESITNSYVSFLIAPDGSKEGWDESRKGDDARDSWKAWANEKWTKGLYCYWVHLSYAGDEKSDTKIVEQAEMKNG